MATKNKTTSSLSKQLASVAAKAKSMGIDTSRADAMIAQTKRQGSKSFAGSREETQFLAEQKKRTGAPTISATDIGTTSPMNMPPVTTSSPKLDALGGSVGPTGIATETAQPQNDRQKIMSTVLGGIERLGQKGQVQEQENVAAGVDEKQRQLDAIEARELRRDRYYENQVRDLEDRGGGLAIGMEAERENLTRNRAREMADIAIEKAVALDDYNTAVSIAQRKVDAEFEPLEKQIQYYGQVYNMMQNDMTESEKMIAQAAIQDKQSSKTYAQTAAQSVYEMLFQSGAATPERMAMVSSAMQDAVTAIESGNSPMESVAKMNNALAGVVSPQQQAMALNYAQLAWQKEQFQLQLAANAEKVLSESLDKAKTEQEANAMKVDKALTIQAKVNEIIKSPGFTSAVGPNPFARWSVAEFATGAKADTLARITELTNLLTIENMGYLKGPASDRDVMLIKEASSRLAARDVTEKDYNTALQEIFGAAGRIASTYGMTSEQAISFGYMIPEETIEASNYWNSAQSTTAIGQP